MKRKKIAIVQSNYIPWKGYFDLIAAVDEFILYDDMQFTKNDWRNRNKIKTPKGIEWISVPVGQNIRRRIRDVELPNNYWQNKHWKTIESNYRRAPHFEEVAALFEPLYRQHQYTNLSALNREMIEAICAYLCITTKISNSWDYCLIDGKIERLVDLCTQAGGTEYISGPAAKDYIDESLFAERGIKLNWFNYAGYPEYPQLWGEFTHNVSILDLLFNCGKDARRYMKVQVHENIDCHDII
ncbi:MAG: WbqC family protein [Desulfobacteraceae bacterium]|nr:WbqC family protein [Desulfobacteraceae bacterium]MBC2756732.1 WbqC family protein [Desulfobacteraceae bacterium]